MSRNLFSFFQIISPQILGWGLVSIARCAWHCVCQGFRNLFKVQKKYYFGLVFPPISACDISKERKQISAQIYNLLFLSRGYTLRVIIKLIYCIVTFFTHCIYISDSKFKKTRVCCWRGLNACYTVCKKSNCTVN